MKDVDRCEENRWYRRRIIQMINKLDNTSFLRSIYIFTKGLTEK
nr:hypothetical protein [uncultured Mediterraneibacter sp.]